MLFKILLSLTLFGVCLAAPPKKIQEVRSTKDIVPIVNQDADISFDGEYHYSYESGDGSKAKQSGKLKTIDKDNAGEVVVGEYEYTGDDGKLYKVTYTADENGFRPEGDHLPKISAIILRALSNIAAGSEKH